jgi:hypothetical protein
MRKNTRGRNPQQRKNRGGGGPLSSMLDMGRLPYFLYDVKQLFMELKIEEYVWTPILSSIVAKASRINLDAAGEFIEKKIEDGALPAEIQKPLFQLLGKYSRMR